jgi:transposase-like protein
MRTYFNDEGLALAKLEAALWPEGPICPHCGAWRRANTVTGRSARIGLRFCVMCRKQFRVTVGTALERSHVPVNKWLLALALLRSIQLSTAELSTTIDVNYRTAGIMIEMIRRALTWRSDGTFEDTIRLLAWRGGRGQQAARSEKIETRQD